MKKVTKGRHGLAQVVGANIKAGRKIKGFTQSYVAQELGVETETVSRYERGLLAPSFPQLEKLCALLDLPAWMLFSEGDSKPDVQAMTVAELLKGLSSRDAEFVLAYVRLYVEHHSKP